MNQKNAQTQSSKCKENEKWRENSPRTFGNNAAMIPMLPDLLWKDETAPLRMNH